MTPRRFLLPLQFALIMLGLSSAPAQVTFELPRSQNATTTETLHQLISTGTAFSVILIPEKGSLLDPNTVSLQWAGEPVPHFLHYKVPATGVLVGLLPGELIRQNPSANLTFSAATHGQQQPARLRVALRFHQDDIRLEPRRGPRIHVLDDRGTPRPNALVFGQRRRDLLTRTDAQGVAILDAPTRGGTSPHYARADGFWTSSFDPLTSRTVRLLPCQVSDPYVRVRLPALPPGSATPEEALLLVADDYYRFARWEEEVQLQVPPGRPPRVLLLAPGLRPQLLDPLP